MHSMNTSRVDSEICSSAAKTQHDSFWVLGWAVLDICTRLRPGAHQCVHIIYTMLSFVHRVIGNCRWLMSLRCAVHSNTLNSATQHTTCNQQSPIPALKQQTVQHHTGSGLDLRLYQNPGQNPTPRSPL